MTLSINFPFSDLIAGYVTSHDSSNDSFTLKTSDEREFKVKISAMAYAKLIQNFDEGGRPPILMPLVICVQC